MQRKIFSFLPTAAAIILLFAGAAAAQQQFTAALNTVQEVPPTSTSGRGGCLITLNAAQTQITTVTCEFSGLSSNVIAGHIHSPAAPGATAGVLFDLTPPTGVTSGTFTRGPFALTAGQLADLKAKRMYVNIHTSNFTNGEIRGQVKIQTTPYDNDGDGRTDIKVYRPSAITTFGIFSVNNTTIVSNIFGFANESPLTSASDDYDGDGRGDIVLLRSSTGGALMWRILQTRSNTIRETQWGNVNTLDDIVPGDYDGDGKTDIAVYRYTIGVWCIIQSSNNQQRYEYWGQPGGNEYGMTGDFDGDGKSDFTIIRGTSNGIGWFTRRSSDNAQRVNYWGGTTAPATDYIFPSVQVDVDGDGIQDRMVIRDPDRNNDGNQITILVQRSSDNTQFSLPFGLDTDEPLFGDYDGDGKTDFAARRDQNGTLFWYIALSSNNWNTATPRVVRFGQTNDFLTEEPVVNDYNPRHAVEIPLEKQDAGN